MRHVVVSGRVVLLLRMTMTYVWGFGVSKAPQPAAIITPAVSLQSLALLSVLRGLALTKHIATFKWPAASWHARQ
jgi:hypothetical protein